MQPLCFKGLRLKGRPAPGNKGCHSWVEIEAIRRAAQLLPHPLQGVQRQATALLVVQLPRRPLQRLRPPCQPQQSMLRLLANAEVPGLGLASSKSSQCASSAAEGRCTGQM